MKEIIYDKLIRDKIPQIIESHGKSCETQILNDPDYKKYLFEKLQEEVDEFLESDSVEELADIMEVIYSILKVKDKTPLDMDEIKQKKLDERGGFDKKLLLNRVRDELYES